MKQSKRGKLILTKEELQKLGEQYRNQEETPYIETNTGEKVYQKHTGAGSKYIGLSFKRIKDLHQKIERQAKKINKVEAIKQGYFPKGNITKVAFADTPQEAEQIIFYMKKYEQLKEVIENMVARLDEGDEMTLTKDSIIVLALKGAIE